jgi:hypothetical protein
MVSFMKRIYRLQGCSEFSVEDSTTGECVYNVGDRWFLT